MKNWRPVILFVCIAALFVRCGHVSHELAIENKLARDIIVQVQYTFYFWAQKIRSGQQELDYDKRKSYESIPEIIREKLPRDARDPMNTEPKQWRDVGLKLDTGREFFEFVIKPGQTIIIPGGGEPHPGLGYEGNFFVKFIFSDSTSKTLAVISARDIAFGPQFRGEMVNKYTKWHIYSIAAGTFGSTNSIQSSQR